MSERHTGRPDFAKGNGLVPCVAQDRASGAVLMVAWMDPTAWDATTRTGKLHFWSRSRQKLWRKGEESGHVLKVASLHLDCDEDTVLALVDPEGPTCHTGAATCFHAQPSPPELPLEHLGRVFEERARDPVEGSHTSRLLQDENLRLKKVAEEAAELIMAAHGKRKRDVTYEAADVLYHVLAACSAVGVSPREVLAELAQRRK